MSRFLFATMPAVGHTRPVLPIARLLVERGHSVRWYAGAAFADAITATGATFLPMSADDFSVEGLDGHLPERRDHQGIRKLRYDMVHGFARPVRSQLRDLREELAIEPADVVVGDTGFIGGPILQELGGPPFAAFGISVLGFPSRDLPPFGLGLRPAPGPLGRLRDRALVRVVRRMFAPMTREINAIRVENGLSPTEQTVFDYQLPARLYLQFGAPSFEYPRTDLPGNVRFVGPPHQSANPDWRKPAWWPELHNGRRVVLVTQGTVATGVEELIEPTLDALADEDVLVIAVTGTESAARPRMIPANARVETFIPFEQLLPHVDVYVTNAGFGGVQIALAHGVPIVAAGKTEDKIEVSARIAYSGVGLDLRTQRPKPEQVRAAVRRILDEPDFADRAGRMRSEIADLGRETATVELLENLARTNRGTQSGVRS